LSLIISFLYDISSQFLIRKVCVVYQSCRLSAQVTWMFYRTGYY
ncbi:unnamed protein product, partial [Brassica oleracea]